jgi:hypothetical protein
MNTSIVDRSTIKFRRGKNNKKHVVANPRPELEEPPPPAPPARVPRVARLVALALRFDRLIREGAITDQADLARLGHITRARATQIMNLLQLAPDILEAILFLPLVESGRDPIRERQVRPIAAVIDWRKQRRLWRALLESRKSQLISSK